MKKIFLNTILLTVSILFLPQIILAADYTLLAPLPGLTSVEESKALQTYLPFIFNLAIGLSGVFAILMIVIGGFQYLSTDAIQKKSEGKERIKNAIYGLVLVLSAWLILNTINPKLLELRLDIEPITVAAPAGGTLGATDLRCSSCVAIPSSISIKSGAGGNIDSGMLPKLLLLNTELKKAGIDLTITEAYPPTRAHQSSCHAYGTCVDVRTVPDDKVYAVIDFGTKSGLKAVFEVESQTRKDAVINASCGSNATCKSTLGERIAVLPPKADGTRQITAEHFSIYKQ